MADDTIRIGMPMSGLDYTQGEAVGGYGTGYRQPTGLGLPGYEPGRFATTPNPALADEWCEAGCCPKRDCAMCQWLEASDA